MFLSSKSLNNFSILMSFEKVYSLHLLLVTLIMNAVLKMWKILGMIPLYQPQTPR